MQQLLRKINELLSILLNHQKVDGMALKMDTKMLRTNYNQRLYEAQPNSIEEDFRPVLTHLLNLIDKKPEISQGIYVSDINHQRIPKEDDEITFINKIVTDTVIDRISDDYHDNYDEDDEDDDGPTIEEYICDRLYYDELNDNSRVAYNLFGLIGSVTTTYTKSQTLQIYTYTTGAQIFDFFDKYLEDLQEDIKSKEYLPGQVYHIMSVTREKDIEKVVQNNRFHNIRVYKVESITLDSEPSYVAITNQLTTQINNSIIENTIMPAMKETSDKTIQELLDILDSKIDKTSILIDNMITGVVNGIKYNYEAEKRSIEQNIQYLRSDINRAYEVYNQKLNQYNSATNRLFFLQNEAPDKAIDETQTNLIRSLIKAGKIKNMYIKNNRLNMLVVGPVIYYDDNVMEIIIKGSRHQIHNSSYTKVKELWLKIFAEDSKHKFMFGKRFIIDLINNKITSNDANMPIEPYSPHPHLELYHCFGGHVNTINHFLSKHDLAGALQACCNAVSNINLNDNTVISTLISELNDLLLSDHAKENTKIILNTETKKELTYNEYLKEIE